MEDKIKDIQLIKNSLLIDFKNYINYLKHLPLQNTNTMSILRSDLIKNVIDILLNDNVESLIEYVENTFTLRYKSENYCGCTEARFNEEFQKIVKNTLLFKKKKSSPPLTVVDLVDKCKFLVEYLGLLTRCINETEVAKYIEDVLLAFSFLYGCIKEIDDDELYNHSDIKSFLVSILDNLSEEPETLLPHVDKRKFSCLIFNIARYLTTRDNEHILQEHFRELDLAFDTYLPLNQLKTKYPEELYESSLFKMFTFHKKEAGYIKFIANLLWDLIEENIITIHDDKIKNIILQEIKMIIDFDSSEKDLYEFIISRNEIYKMIIAKCFPYDENVEDLNEYENVLKEYINEIEPSPPSPPPSPSPPSPPPSPPPPQRRRQVKSKKSSSISKSYREKRDNATIKLLKNINTITFKNNVKNSLVKAILNESNSNSSDGDRNLERIYNYVRLYK